MEFDLRTGIVILAAGASTRMGRPKQLLEYQGKNLLNRTIDTALSIHPKAVCVVLGANSEKILPTIDLKANVFIAINNDWEKGMGSTLSMGLQTLLSREPTLDAVLLLVIDQPSVSEDLLKEMIKVFQSHKGKIIAAQYADTLGVPAIFDQCFFSRLVHLDPETGAQKIIRSQLEDCVPFPFPEGKMDLDTPEDWQKWVNKSCL